MSKYVVTLDFIRWLTTEVVMNNTCACLDSDDGSTSYGQFTRTLSVTPKLIARSTRGLGRLRTSENTVWRSIRNKYVTSIPPPGSLTLLLRGVTATWVARPEQVHPNSISAVVTLSNSNVGDLKFTTHTRRSGLIHAKTRDEKLLKQTYWQTGDAFVSWVQPRK